VAGADQFDDLHAHTEATGIGDDIAHLVGVLLLQQQVHIDRWDHLDGRLDPGLDLRDVAGLARRDRGDRGIGEVVQANLDPIQGRC
jgi:hypothetical protein